MIDVQQLNAASAVAWESGHRLLHTHRFYESDYAQVDYLMRCYKPHGEVLDVGCGFGEVARLMVDLGTFANFHLLNISDYQLSKCPQYMDQTLGSAHNMPYPDSSFDGVMFNTTLCNVDQTAALAEAYRVLKPGGALMLSDVVIPVGVAYDRTAMAAEMHAHVGSAYDLICALYRHGFTVADFRIPVGTVDHMRNLGEEQTERLFRPLRPLVLRATKVPPRPALSPAPLSEDRSKSSCFLSLCVH